MPKLHGSKSGQGPNLVLLHGWGSSSKVWQYVAGELGKKFQVWCIDLPGHGDNHAVQWDCSTKQGVRLLADTNAGNGHGGRLVPGRSDGPVVCPTVSASRDSPDAGFQYPAIYRCRAMAAWHGLRDPVGFFPAICEGSAADAAKILCPSGAEQPACKAHALGIAGFIVRPAKARWENPVGPAVAGTD